MELFWNSLDNVPSSIVFYLEMKVEVEVGVDDIKSRFTPRLKLIQFFSILFTYMAYKNSNLCFRPKYTILKISFISLWTV